MIKSTYLNVRMLLRVLLRVLLRIRMVMLDADAAGAGQLWRRGGSGAAWRTGKLVSTSESK